MNKDMEITIQYQKIQLSGQIYLLKPIKSVLGKSVEEKENSEYFMTEDHTRLEAIDNIEALQDDSSEFFYDQGVWYEEDDDLNENLTSSDKKKILEEHFLSYGENFGIVEINEDETVSCVFSDITSIQTYLEMFDTPEEEIIINEDDYDRLMEIDDLQELKEEISNIVFMDSQKAPSYSTPSKKIDIQELEDYVKERIIGHREQIEDIITIIAMNLQAENPHEVERILVAGPTGIGKTETFQTIAEYLKIPFCNYAVTTLSDAGLVGKDIEDILKNVYEISGYNLEATKRAILTLDEIDKLAIRNNEVAQVNVQQNLLKLLEGHTFDVKVNDITKLIDTRFMSIIGCGAFPTLFEEKKQIGFQDHVSTNSPKTIPLKDFFHFGMIPEFIGRFGQIHIFEPLSDMDCYKVLTLSKISPFLIKQQQFVKNFQVNLQADESYYQEILVRNKKSDIGLRSLKNEVNHSLLKLENQLLKNPGVYHEAFISKETVKDNHQYILK